jgi:YHS domain-containing protein
MTLMTCLCKGCGVEIPANRDTVTLIIGVWLYFFCSTKCKDMFDLQTN